MSNPQDIWNLYKDRLKKSHVDKDKEMNAWKDLWANDCQFIVKYGKQGKDGYEEEILKGRDKIVKFFSGAIDKIVIDFKDDGPVYETKNKPETFLVISDFIATIVEGGYPPYKNRIVCYVTLDTQGKIKEMVEYTDPIKRQNFLERL